VQQLHAKLPEPEEPEEVQRIPAGVRGKRQRARAQKVAAATSTPAPPAKEDSLHGVEDKVSCKLLHSTLFYSMSGM
jgi:hypothetical protein